MTGTANEHTDEKAALDSLWKRYKENDDKAAKDELLLHYTHLVKWVVNRLMPKYNNYSEREDLYSCGVIGLIDALGKYDASFGVKFETYAVPRIRGEILDYMRSRDWAPPSLRRKINAINNAYDAIGVEPGDNEADTLVAETVDMPVSQVQKILNQSYIFNIINFEDTLEARHKIEDISGPGGDEPEMRLLEKERRDALVAAIDALPERERLVVTLHYYEGLLLREIADILNVTESRVSQIHSKAVSRMSAKMKRFV